MWGELAASTETLRHRFFVTRRRLVIMDIKIPGGVQSRGAI